MTFKMIKTTNSSFNYLKGAEGSLSIGVIIRMDYPDGRWFRSSSIQNIKYEYGNNIKLHVTTRNSEYVFEEVT